MRFELKLALKFFRSKKKSLTRFTSLVAVVGVAAGVASLIVAQALARGFQDEMRDKILANTAHVSVALADGAPLAGWREIKADLERAGNVREVAPAAFENALVVAESETSYAVLKADARGRLAGSQIAVGARLAEKLNLKVGDAAQVLTPERQTPTRVRVAEIFATGLYDYDATWVAVAPDAYAYLRGDEVFTPTALAVSVEDIYRSGETTLDFRERLGARFRVVDWQEANRPLFAALSLERQVSLAVISLIVFIAALNITTTLALLVNERRLDIAVLRTCGARARSLIAAFLLEGMLLGVFGVLGGVIAGLLACLAGNYFKLVSLAEEVYALSYVPLRPRPASVLLIVSVALALCLIATAYPAWRAGRVKPLENLRDQ